MKFTLKNRPKPCILMTQPYISSVNINTLMIKIREWEIFADSLEKEPSVRKLEEHLRDFPCNGCEKRHLVCDHCISDNILPYWKQIRAEFMQIFDETFAEEDGSRSNKP